MGANKGATAAARTGDETTVTFNRDVSKCSYTASVNGAAPEALAVRSAGASGTALNQVIVADAAGGTTPAIHLQVIC